MRRKLNGFKGPLLCRKGRDGIEPDINYTLLPEGKEPSFKARRDGLSVEFRKRLEERAIKGNCPPGKTRDYITTWPDITGTPVSSVGGKPSQ